MRAARQLDVSTLAAGPLTGAAAAARQGVSVDELAKLGMNGYNQAITYRRGQVDSGLASKLAALDMWMYGFALGRLYEKEVAVDD